MLSFELWTSWIPPDLHGFFTRVMEAFSARAEFIQKVVQGGQGTRLQSWANWSRDLAESHPFKWLRPDLFLLPLVLSASLLTLLGSWFSPHLLVLIAVGIGCHTFAGLVTLLSTLKFFDFVWDHLSQAPFPDLPILTGGELYEAAMLKKSTARGLDGWAWNMIKTLSLSWFVGVAFVLRMTESLGQWPQGLVDGSFAMIPEAEGVSTPLGQRPLCVFPGSQACVPARLVPLSLLLLVIQPLTFLK